MSSWIAPTLRPKKSRCAISLHPQAPTRPPTHRRQFSASPSPPTPDNAPLKLTCFAELTPIASAAQFNRELPRTSSASPTSTRPRRLSPRCPMGQTSRPSSPAERGPLAPSPDRLQKTPPAYRRRRLALEPCFERKFPHRHASPPVNLPLAFLSDTHLPGGKTQTSSRNLDQARFAPRSKRACVSVMDLPLWPMSRRAPAHVVSLIRKAALTPLPACPLACLPCTATC